MHRIDQRKLAASIVAETDPSLRDVILDEDNCYEEILKALKPHRDKILAMWEDSWPQEWAYEWARRIGDRHVMRDRVMEPNRAYWWAIDIGDRDVMRDRITESAWAYQWTIHIGDRDVMRDRITESEWAYEWAIDIGDRDVMRPIAFKDPVWKDEWVKHFGE